jgi:3-deoxy-D-manno-octulosonate 8-phosphate phosphatase (KDO 8-P phosphatase)
MVRGLIFDWDGVWTDGRKRPDGHSEFSEHDTMGLNLLRFGHYLHTGEMLRVALVTGERNLTAEHVAQREHIDQFLFYARDKTKAIPLLTERWSQSPSDWAFVFDDVLDFGLAAQVGRRAMVAWPWTEGVRELAQKHELVDDWIPTPSPVPSAAKCLARTPRFPSCTGQRASSTPRRDVSAERRASGLRR